jgi:hypothetical protein
MAPFRAQASDNLSVCTVSGPTVTGPDTFTDVTCTVHEGESASFTLAVDPLNGTVGSTALPGLVPLCESTSDTCRSATDVSSFSDVLTISGAPVTGGTEITLALLSDTNSESGTQWCSQETPSTCYSLTNLNTFAPFEGEGVNGSPGVARCIHPGGNIHEEICVTITLVSDSAATPEAPETVPSIPQFGAPVLLVAAIGLAALLLLRRNSLTTRKN